MRNSRIRPAVNTGSMADIAFLLLIFFLVTTTITVEQGIARDLPEPCPAGHPCELPIKENNLLTIAMSDSDQLFVNEMLADISELKELLINFIDNNGDGTCDYCNGPGLPLSSDNPKAAVIKIETMRKATYDNYIALQDELTAVFFELRARYGQKQFKKFLKDLTPSEIQNVKNAYPFRIMEQSL